MADALDSKSSDICLVGSSPISCTKKIKILAIARVLIFNVNNKNKIVLNFK